jgi:hypothetical protein
MMKMATVMDKIAPRTGAATVALDGQGAIS